MDHHEIHRQVTREMLIQFLHITGESDRWDFKEVFDISTARSRVELACDVFAFANMPGGGHIIFGVNDREHRLVGIPPNTEIDATKIYNAIRKYSDAPIELAPAIYEVQEDGWGSPRRFGILYIARSPSIVMATEDGTYEEGGKTRFRFKKGDILARFGTQSSKIDNLVTLNRLIQSHPPQTVPLLEEKHPLDDNLPLRDEIAVDFVGRRAELQSLWQWIGDEDRPRWILAGYGGKGKTAIAYEFATQVRSVAPSNLVCIIWLSAKRRKYQYGEIKQIVDPDFSDLSGLLDAIAQFYGYSGFLSLPMAEKKKEALTLLDKLPALLVVDDLDSLGLEASDAFEFLNDKVTRTATKVLFTIRESQILYSGCTTIVGGLDNLDAIKFLESRVRLFHLDPQMFDSHSVQKILEVTDASPLFMEDLLRLCAVLPVAEALREWQNRGGDLARRYALEREFDRLSANAKAITLASCLYRGPISSSEIQAITGLPQQIIVDEMPKIQNLFLVARPKLIEGVPRFEVNSNTRTLILDVYEQSDLLRRLTNAAKAISGQIGRSQDRQASSEIGSYIRQAISLTRLHQFPEAERTLLGALERYPDHPDLVGQLGLVYWQWEPHRRIADARKKFERAAELKCKREVVYLSWSKMEKSESEWSTAAQAAERGMQNSGMSMQLCFEAGYCWSMLGQELRRHMHTDLANQRLRTADTRLREALKPPEQLADHYERHLNSQVYRALVLNCHALGDIDEMRRLLDQWCSEHPDDPKAMSERDRLMSRYPVKPRHSQEVG